MNMLFRNRATPFAAADLPRPASSEPDVDEWGESPHAEKMRERRLKERLRTTDLSPDDMVQGAVRSLRALADTRLSESATGYGGDDLAEIEAEIAGIRKVATLMKPLGAASAPAAQSGVADRMAALDADLASLKGPNGYPSFPTSFDGSDGQLTMNNLLFEQILEPMQG